MVKITKTHLIIDSLPVPKHLLKGQQKPISDELCISQPKVSRILQGIKNDPELEKQIRNWCIDKFFKTLEPEDKSGLTLHQQNLFRKFKTMLYKYYQINETAA